MPEAPRPSCRTLREAAGLTHELGKQVGMHCLKISCPETVTSRPVVADVMKLLHARWGSPATGGTRWSKWRRTGANAAGEKRTVAGIRRLLAATVLARPCLRRGIIRDLRRRSHQTRALISHA
jgi:hypothetical protein